MMKQFQIAIDSMCVAAILSAGAPVLAEEAPDTSGVQLAMEYLLSQDASDNVKVSFRMCDHGDRYGGLIIVPGGSSLQTFVLSSTLLHSNKHTKKPESSFLELSDFLIS